MACGARVVRRGGFNAERRNDVGLIHTKQRHDLSTRPLLQTVGRADSFSGAGRFVVSQLFDALYVCRAPSESCADLVVVGAFVSPAEHTSLQRS